MAHADLPLADDLARLAGFAGVTLVPDRRDDGTNVVCVPTGAGFALLLRARFVRPPPRRGGPARLPSACCATRLGWDVDVPADLELPELPCS